jgi:broad specificity phosphatase PhoE
MPAVSRDVDLPAFEQVLLARHGQTEWNVLGRRQGQLDSPLTAEGHRNAERLAALAAREDIDGVFSSPIGRSLTTATTIGDLLGREVTVIDELTEVHHGDLAGLSDSETAVRFPGLLDGRRADLYGWRFPGDGGESYADGAARVVTALHRVAATGSRRPVLVAHEMIGRMVIMVLEGLEPSVALARGLPHGEYVRFG